MAIAVGSVSNTPTHGSRTNTTITAPTGIANGDVLVAVLFVGHASALPLLTVTPPAGFTEVTNSPSGTADSDPYEISIRVYRKAASGESGNYTFTHAAAETQGFMYRLTGVDTSTPIDATPVAAAYATNGGQTTTYGSATTVTDGCFLIFAEAVWDGPGSGTVSGTTPSIAVRRSGTVNWIGDGTQTTAGATGSRTRTNGNGSISSRWASIVVPVRPAGAGGPVTTPQTVTVAGATTVAASKRTGKVVAAVSAGTAAVVKRANKAVSVACAGVCLPAKRAGMAASVTVGSAVATGKLAGKTISAGAASAVAIARAIGKAIAATSATTAAANATRAFLKTIAVSATGSVSLTKRAGKAIGVATSGALAITRLTTKTLAASASSAVSAAVVKARSVVIDATVGSAVAIRRAVGASLAVSATGALTMSRAIAFRVAIASATAVATRKTITKALAATAGTMLDIVRNMGGAAAFELTKRVVVILNEIRRAIAPAESRAASVPSENRSARVASESRSTSA